MKLTPALVLFSALPLAAQATSPSAAHPAAHSAHHSGTAAGGCAKLPEISSKVPALPAGTPCPKALYTITTRPGANLDYVSPEAQPNLAETLGIESSSFTLAFVDTKVGTGESAYPHKNYTVNYTGYLVDGTKFDSSLDRKEPFSFPVGQHRVVTGWDTGFGGMKVGGKRRLFVPWQLAYGATPHGNIPAKSMLIFDLELVSVSDAPPAPPARPVSPRPLPQGTVPPTSITPGKPGSVTSPASGTKPAIAPTTPATTNPTADPTKPTTAPPPVTTPAAHNSEALALAHHPIRMFERIQPLRPYLRRYWQHFAWGGVAVLLYNTIRAILPLIIGHAVDDLRTGITAHKIEVHALRLLGVAAASAIFLYITRQVIIGASREIEFDLRNDLFRNLERQSADFYQTHRTGDIMARATNDLSAVRQLLGPAIMYSANTIVFTAAALPLMFRISPRLTLIAFVPLPIASVLVQQFGARIHRRFERIQAMFSDISAKAQENFSGARLIRAFAQEEAEMRSFETANQEYIARSLLLVRLMAMLWPTLELVLGISLVLSLLVGGHDVVRHRISVGQFTEFMVYMVQLTWPMIAIGWVVNLFQRGTASLVRIDELLKAEPSIQDEVPTKSALSTSVANRSTQHPPDLSFRSEAEESASASLPAATPMRGEITFRHLSFAYASGPEVLDDISLTIPAGSSLAIVGPTGSGKSTLVNLIARLYDAPSGEVFIDGTPIRQWPLETLRANIGFVPQETFLFSTSIADNVAFGVPGSSEQAIEEAAAIARIRDEILEFPHGFATMVGERGVTLSGGQKQRTAIARAILRDPRILILDDALASVDTSTEEQILSGLRRVMEGRTTILISHRTSTARNADQIAVLVDGRIAELGTHDQLLTRNGYYTRLYEKQQLEEEIAVAQ